MRKNGRFRGLRFVAFGLLGAIVVSLITMELWNVLMPAIFNLPAISGWQALGLLVLGRLLFGGFGPRGRGWHRRPRFTGDMTPEERERFREGIRQKCGGFESPESAPRM